MSKAIILEAKSRKRISKKIKTEYFRLALGEVWLTSINGERISVIADKDNTQTIFVGQAK